MPLQRLQFRSGINRESTTYANEGGYYECDKVRFRSGYPEKIGGWIRLSINSFLGVCRTLFNWVALDTTNLLGIGTHLKYYVERGGVYNDITPLRATINVAANAFTTVLGSTTITVNDASGGFFAGDFVTISGSGAVNGIPASEINGEHQIVSATATTWTFTTTTAATSSGTTGAATFAYQINVGLATYIAGGGWSAGGFGRSTWGSGVSGTTAGAGSQMRLWNHSNFGEDLVYGPRDGAIYFWNYDVSFPRGVLLSTLPGAADVPSIHKYLIVSDNRFLIAFGVNPIGSATQDPMLIRWADQESLTQWTPAITNQAGEQRLARGSQIITASQTRQEILVWTDASLYSMQYVGPDPIWGFTILADNTSIISPGAATTVNNVTYWMGSDKFYIYTGRVEVLPCALRQYVFGDINTDQSFQVVSGSNEGFNEVWWHYCSAESNEVDKYVIYNYLERVWYYGTLDRTAWLDSPLRQFPMAAANGTILYHEASVDDESTGTPQAIVSYVQSADFDIGDGHNFGFVWRVIPDVTFSGSTAANPSVTFTVRPRRNPGADYGTDDNPVVTRTQSVPVEQYTQYAYVRMRGRQMALKVGSDTLGTMWQLGAPRLDVRPSGRK